MRAQRGCFQQSFLGEYSNRAIYKGFAGENLSSADHLPTEFLSCRQVVIFIFNKMLVIFHRIDRVVVCLDYLKIEICVKIRKGDYSISLSSYSSGTTIVKGNDEKVIRYFEQFKCRKDL